LLLVLGGAAAAFSTAVLKGLQAVVNVILTALEYGMQSVVSPVMEILGVVSPVMKILWMGYKHAKSSFSEIYDRNKADSEMGGLGALAKKVGESAQMGLKEGSAILLEGLPKAAKSIQDILASTKFENLNLLGSKEKLAALGNLASDLAKIGAKAADESKKRAEDGAKRPGEGRKGPALRLGLGGEGSYDDFRRVGGGISGAVTNMQQRMYDKLASIATYAQQQADLTRQLVARSTGGAQSLELGGVR